MGRCVVVIVIKVVLVVELTDGVVDGFDGFGEVVSGHLVPSLSYQQIISCGGGNIRIRPPGYLSGSGRHEAIRTVFSHKLAVDYPLIKR